MRKSILWALCRTRKSILSAEINTYTELEDASPGWTKLVEYVRGCGLAQCGYFYRKLSVLSWCTQENEILHKIRALILSYFHSKLIATAYAKGKQHQDTMLKIGIRVKHKLPQ